MLILDAQYFIQHEDAMAPFPFGHLINTTITFYGHFVLARTNVHPSIFL